MDKSNSNPFAAGEQGLGYIYQSRFALLRIFQLSEDTTVMMEKDDDLDFVNDNGYGFIGEEFE